MKRQVEFHPDAAEEAVNAHHWYCDINTQLGEEFQSEPDWAIDRVAMTPEHWPHHLQRHDPGRKNVEPQITTHLNFKTVA